MEVNSISSTPALITAVKSEVPSTAGGALFLGIISELTAQNNTASPSDSAVFLPATPENAQSTKKNEDTAAAFLLNPDIISHLNCIDISSFFYPGADRPEASDCTEPSTDDSVISIIVASDTTEEKAQIKEACTEILTAADVSASEKTFTAVNCTVYHPPDTIASEKPDVPEGWALARETAPAIARNAEYAAARSVTPAFTREFAISINGMLEEKAINSYDILVTDTVLSKPETPATDTGISTAPAPDSFPTTGASTRSISTAADENVFTPVITESNQRRTSAASEQISSTPEKAEAAANASAIPLKSPAMTETDSRNSFKTDSAKDQSQPFPEMPLKEHYNPEKTFCLTSAAKQEPGNLSLPVSETKNESSGAEVTDVHKKLPQEINPHPNNTVSGETVPLTDNNKSKTNSFSGKTDNNTPDSKEKVIANGDGRINAFKNAHSDASDVSCAAPLKKSRNSMRTSLDNSMNSDVISNEKPSGLKKAADLSDTRTTDFAEAQTTRLSPSYAAKTQPAYINEAVAPEISSSVRAQLIDEIYAKYSSGIKSFQIVINPKELGTVTVKMSMKSSSLVIELLAQDSRTQNVILSNSSEIKAILQNQLNQNVNVEIVHDQNSGYPYGEPNHRNPERDAPNDSRKQNKDRQNDNLTSDFLSVINIIKKQTYQR